MRSQSCDDPPLSTKEPPFQKTRIRPRETLDISRVSTRIGLESIQHPDVMQMEDRSIGQAPQLFQGDRVEIQPMHMHEIRLQIGKRPLQAWKIHHVETGRLTKRRELPDTPSQSDALGVEPPREAPLQWNLVDIRSLLALVNTNVMRVDPCRNKSIVEPRGRHRRPTGVVESVASCQVDDSHHLISTLSHFEPNFPPSVTHSFSHGTIS